MISRSLCGMCREKYKKKSSSCALVDESRGLIFFFLLLFILLSLCMHVLDLSAPAVCHPYSNKADSLSGAPPRLTLASASCVQPDCRALQLVSENCSAAFWDGTLKLFPRAPGITYTHRASHCGGGVDTLKAHKRKANTRGTQNRPHTAQM